MFVNTTTYRGLAALLASLVARLRGLVNPSAEYDAATARRCLAGGIETATMAEGERRAGRLVAGHPMQSSYRRYYLIDRVPVKSLVAEV